MAPGSSAEETLRTAKLPTVLLLSFALSYFQMHAMPFFLSGLGRVELGESFKRCPESVWTMVVRPACLFLERAVHGLASFFSARVVMSLGVDYDSGKMNHLPFVLWHFT